MPPRCRAILVCDDLRQEIGNKMTAVGLYSDSMGFPAGDGPVGLPKLALVFTIAGLRGVQQLRFRYTFKFTPALGPVPAVPAMMDLHRPDENMDEHNFMFQMVPAVFPGPGTFEFALDLEIEGEVYHYGHSIRVVRGAAGAESLALPVGPPN